jgi:MFS family permease
MTSAPTTRTLTLVVAAALFMESLTSTVIATSLAAIAADLQVDPVTLKLAFTAYYVALAIFIPISGWCADRFGAKTVFRRGHRRVHAVVHRLRDWPGTCPAWWQAASARAWAAR